MFNGCKGCKFINESKDNIKRLSDLNVNEEGIVLSVAGNDDLRTKIMEMGIITNTKLKVTKKAPFDDPIAILLRGYDLTLRKNEANLILVNLVK